MPSKRLLLALALFASAAAAAPNLVVGPNGTLYIYNPDKATAAEMTDPANRGRWTVSVRPSAGSPDIPLPVLDVTAHFSATRSNYVAVFVDTSALVPRDPRHYGWTVTFPLSTGPLRLTVPPPNTSFFAPARNKDDANLYFFGSYLAGEATKPIYSIDAKIGYVPEIHASGISLGIEAAATVNSGSQPPSNRTRVDPDSITADIALRTIRGNFLINAYPARGEFSRKNAESNFVPSAMVQYAPKPLFQSPRHAFVLYETAGIEAGTNLNKPASVFKQPVNFSGYDKILRGVIGGYAAYYILKKSGATAGDPYAAQVSLTYIGRILATDEPYVTSQTVRGAQVPLILLDDKMRHHIDGVILWNVSDFVGIQVKYTYGALPPLFQACAHQVTFGITFKAKLQGHI
jgi:hypothetical protein